MSHNFEIYYFLWLLSISVKIEIDAMSSINGICNWASMFSSLTAETQFSLESSNYLIFSILNNEPGVVSNWFSLKSWYYCVLVWSLSITFCSKSSGWLDDWSTSPWSPDFEAWSVLNRNLNFYMCSLVISLILFFLIISLILFTLLCFSFFLSVNIFLKRSLCLLVHTFFFPIVSFLVYFWACDLTLQICLVPTYCVTRIQWVPCNLRASRNLSCSWLVHLPYFS